MVSYFCTTKILKMASAAEDERGQPARRRFWGRRATAAAVIRPCSSTSSASGRSASSSSGRSSSSPPALLPSILLFLLFHLFIGPVFRSKSAVVSACFPGGPGSGCCSASSCGSVPRCTPSSMASSHLSSFSHVAPPPPIYGHDDDHQHYGGGYDKHGYGGSGYGEKGEYGGGYDNKEYGGKYGDKGGYGNGGYGGKEYGGGGYGDRGGYENKGYGAKYGDNGYDKGYGGDKEYGGGGYGSPNPSTNVQYPAYPGNSYVAPPPAYPPINYNNFYPIAPPTMPPTPVYSPYTQPYPATPIQYPAPPYQASESNFLPPYVQQQSLYSSPPGIIPSSSPYSAVDLYQPNLPPQYTADQPYTLPTSSSPDLLVASPYRQQTLSPANGPFVMTLAEPPAFVSAATAAQQPPAGGYSAKVKSTKVLTTLVDKFKKDSKKNER